MQQTATTFASRVFRIAAIYGVLVLLPAYLLPVPDPFLLTHLGFVGLALVFQAMFWLIARDPGKYAALVPLGIAEKLAFGIPAAILFALGKADPIAGGFGLIDLLWAAMFLLVLRRLRKTA